VLSIGALIVATFWVLRPFLTPVIWAAMIVVSPWPMLRWFEAPLMQQQLAYARSDQFESPPRLSPRAGEGRRVRLHREVLQSPAPTLDAGLPESRRL
jgi:hypothetical protein